MNRRLSHLSQGDLIAFSKDMIEGDKHFSTEAWAFPDTLRNSLITTAENYENLYLAQNLSESEKEKLMRAKNDHFKNKLIPALRRVVHYIKATADDPENVLNGYGYDLATFRRRRGTFSHWAKTSSKATTIRRDSRGSSPPNCDINWKKPSTKAFLSMSSASSPSAISRKPRRRKTKRAVFWKKCWRKVGNGSTQMFHRLATTKSSNFMD